MSWWEALNHYWQELTAWGALLDVVLTVLTIAWVLAIKKDSTSALAWCLLVILLPLLGPFLFFVFGYQHVHRPMLRKRKHKKRFRQRHPAPVEEATPGLRKEESVDTSWEGISRLAQRFDGFPLTPTNDVRIYHEGRPAFDAMLEAIRSARHHIHLESYIFQPDASGQLFIEELARKAREGVEVRLLYDAMGSYRLGRRILQPLKAAGGRCSAFLPLSLLRRRLQINMRNHRKILVVDGRLAFTGGLNIGDEYLGKHPRMGFWRDTHLRLEGPAVSALQRIFTEDWDFAAGENLQAEAYFPRPKPAGSSSVQVIQSGPDQELKSIREIYFAAILRARKRLWIATPYFVPDAGLQDALRLAGHLDVDVRLICQFHPDKWLPFFAGRYYWGDAMEAGVKVYQYTRGMMHAKVMLVDGEWASVGSANLDNRSMHLNFEVNCLLYSPELVAELESAFLRDLESCIQLEPTVFARRPFTARLVENACRLLSPVL